MSRGETLAAGRPCVEPYTGDGRRITIAWNLFHPQFAVPQYSDEGMGRAGVVLPRRWKAVGEVLERVLPITSNYISYSRSPVTQTDDWAGSLDEVLKDKSVSELCTPNT